MRSRIVWIVLSVAALAARAAGGPNDARVAALTKQDSAAREKCADDLVRLARGLAEQKAFEEARDELRRAMAIAPADAGCRKEFAKLASAAGKTPDAAREKSTAMREPVHAHCAAVLADVLKAWDGADRPDEFARLATSVKAELSGDAALAGFELEWSEDFGLWLRKKDAARLATGAEFIDGAWVEAADVAKQDAAHADWKKPWVLSDGVHEVRTTMSRLTAKRVLEHVSEFRRVVLDEFTGEWDLKAPRGVLPVIVTATQSEFAAKIREIPAQNNIPNAAAVYLRGSTALNPCFATFEPKDTDGSTKKVGWPGLLFTLRHEIAHQILFEYSKQASGGMGSIGWCSEGLANLLACFEPVKGHWRLRRRAEIPFATGYIPGAFAWVQSNFAEVAPLSKLLVDIGDPTTATAYFVDTVLVDFLLEGDGRRHRASMIKLAQLVHQGGCDATTFGKVFGKVDFPKLQSEWQAFVRSIEIEK
ncbi:MAG: hypothetical protein HY292_00860 [Planctomycetes bacterium]|nr:hypothetical protein [Planctomycetota bacterium]